MNFLPMTIPATMKIRRSRHPAARGWQDAPVPQPGPGEVLVRVLGVATCPQDLHIFGGQPMFPRMKISIRICPDSRGLAAGDVVAPGRRDETPRGCAGGGVANAGEPHRSFYAQFNTFHEDDLSRCRRR